MERLSTHQFMVLSAGVILGTTFLPLGTLVTGIAGRDGWMAVLPGLLLGIPFGLMLLSMIPKYPNKNFLEITEKVLGKWIGKAIGLLYVFIIIYFGAVLSGQGFDMITRTIMPLMSRNVFLLVMIFMAIYIYHHGIEVLSRFSEVVFPIVAGAIILITILIIPRFEQGELFPILAEGPIPVLKASVKVAPWSMIYILVLAGLLPFLPKKSSELKQMKKGIWRAILIVAFLNTLVALIQILTFGPFEAKRLNYGLLVLSKMIEISKTVTGVESIFELIWMGTYIIKIGALFFAGMWGVKSVFGLKSNNWCLILALIYAGINLLFPRGAQIIAEIGLIDDYATLPFGIFWVLLVWGMDQWKSYFKSR